MKACFDSNRPVTLGLPAIFLWGDNAVPFRCAACTSKGVTSWFRAVPRGSPITASRHFKDGQHPLTGAPRLTFRKVFGCRLYPGHEPVRAWAVRRHLWLPLAVSTKPGRKIS